MAETRQFKMHPRLLFDVIKRQAGTLTKALLEGVMNAVDAGATRCDVTVTATEAVVSDNGRGFRSRKEIEDWFEVFGQPHDESEHKTYGTFRMGRGQLFAFGCNDWRTGRYRMHVDVKGKGLDYDLVCEPQKHKGCCVHVSLYEPLDAYHLQRVPDQLSRWVKWVPVPVVINGIVANPVPAAEGDWTFVTDDAYVKLDNSNQLTVYNLGVYVQDCLQSQFGTGGVVVSRKALEVNFARNDVQHTCPVWKRISAEIAQRSTKELFHGTLSAGQRQRAVDMLLSGELPPARAKELALLTLVTGRHCTPAQLFAAAYNRPICHTKDGSPLGDSVHRSRTAFVLGTSTLARFRQASLEQLHQTLARFWPAEAGRLSAISFEKASAGMVDQYSLVDDTDWTDKERIWLASASAAENAILYALHAVDPTAKLHHRRLLIGESPTRDAWTDGDRYIAISRQWLQQHDYDVAGFVALGHLLLHEYCHQQLDTEAHDHDQEFYERFHDAADGVCSFVQRALGRLPATLAVHNRRMSKRAAKAAKLVEQAATAVEAQATAARMTTAESPQHVPAT